MKKLLSMLAVIILSISIFAGCANQKPKDTKKDDDKNNTIKEYTVTVTPPQGWEVTPGSGTLLRYKKDSGDFWVVQGFAGGTMDADIDYYKQRESAGGYEITWDAVVDAKVNNIDAKYLKYIVKTSSLQMRYDAYFIKKDAALFTVICLTCPEADYDDVQVGFKALLDSLRITEK